MQQTADRLTIGRSILITVDGIADIPAKVDTGADSSSLWATHVHETPEGLSFTLFDADVPYYTGKVVLVPPAVYQQTTIASSTGHRQQRYAVTLPVIIAGKQLDVRFTLADRSTMAYPILLGCDCLAGNFLVDPAQRLPLSIHQTIIAQKERRNQKGARA